MILLCGGLHVLGSLLTVRLQRVGLLLAAGLRVLPVIHAVCLGCRSILLPARLDAMTSLRPGVRGKAATRGGTFAGEIAMSEPAGAVFEPAGATPKSTATAPNSAAGPTACVGVFARPSQDHDRRPYGERQRP